jgi:hypothetical protein
MITQVGKDTGAPREEQHASIVAGLRAAAPILEAYGVTLMIEPLNTLVNHPGYYLTAATEAFAIIDEVGSPRVKVIYDIYHQQVTEGNILPSILNNLDKIAHLHGAGHPGRHELQNGENDYRFIMKAVDEAGNLRPNETLADLLRNFPHWFNPDMAPYAGHEEALPFDQHFLKALVAPRILLETDAASDIWANPVGSNQTSLAAREVYRFLGKEENLVHTFRPGYHEHKPRDLQTLVNVMKAKIAGQPLCEDNFRLPFPEQERIFDWRCPV